MWLSSYFLTILWLGSDRWLLLCQLFIHFDSQHYFCEDIVVGLCALQSDLSERDELQSPNRKYPPHSNASPSSVSMGLSPPNSPTTRGWPHVLSKDAVGRLTPQCHWAWLPLPKTSPANNAVVLAAPKWLQPSKGKCLSYLGVPGTPPSLHSGLWAGLCAVCQCTYVWGHFWWQRLQRGDSEYLHLLP